jgi:plastocyanin
MLAASSGYAPGSAEGQSVLDRSPNLQGVWTLPRGEAAFIFAHRFEFVSGGDEMFNIPTLTLALGLPLGVTGGLDFSSNSEIAADNIAGNETQYWLKRTVPIGSRIEMAIIGGYNSAADSWDGAIDVRHQIGPLAGLAELRGFSDRFGRGEIGVAGAVGGVLRLTDYLGVTADYGRALDEDSLPAVWSAAVAIAIPGSPHTFSIQATNGGAITLQGASRTKVIGAAETRYGFVFTVPLGGGARWARIFQQAPTPTAPADTSAMPVRIQMVAFTPGEVRIGAGQSIEWLNMDPIQHTVTSDDGEWTSPLLPEGGRYSRTFTEPGRYQYHCTPHPQMRGVVIVETG